MTFQSKFDREELVGKRVPRTRNIREAQFLNTSHGAGAIS